LKLKPAALYGKYSSLLAISQLALETGNGRYHSVTAISWAGAVHYVEDISGKWAPSPVYHERIVEMLEEMLGPETVTQSS